LMKQSLSARIAWRYLRAKKSHSAVGAISVVSICGIAVATAAIICVLSVFNGFKSVIADRVDTLAPDVMVTPANGKAFANGDSVAEVIRTIPEVEIAIPTILENALAIYEGRETPVSIKGADLKEYEKITALNNLLIDKIDPSEYSDYSDKEYSDYSDNSDNSDSSDKEYSDFSDNSDFSTIAVGTASKLGARPGARILLFTPRREGRVNLANPVSSFLRDSVIVTGVYRANQSEYDENRVIVDLNVARDLLQYDLESTAVEVKGKRSIDSSHLASLINEKLNASGNDGKTSGSKGDNVTDASGKRFVVKDRLQQQEMNFRMIAIEKWITFLLLFFILLIASFNIISSLSMLVIEKEKSMSTLKALG
ncbi:MAG: ABC transporter permease, partial [Muribaculaceae bacterium]|nr:ABC transporter permease [Muribaculaceae bacterium]